MTPGDRKRRSKSNPLAVSLIAESLNASMFYHILSAVTEDEALIRLLDIAAKPDIP